MIPQLDAEEAITLSNTVALGTGTLKPEAARKLQRDIERRARGRSSARPIGDQLGAFADLGFAVERD